MPMPLNFKKLDELCLGINTMRVASERVRMPKFVDDIDQTQIDERLIACGASATSHHSFYKHSI